MADEGQRVLVPADDDPDGRIPEEATDPETTPRWWVVVWSIWGLVLALLVLVFDHEPLIAGCWVLAGVLMGMFSMRALEFWMLATTPWYEKLWPPDLELEGRLHELFEAERTDEEEFVRIAMVQSFGGLLGGPPFIGVVHGTLFGAIGGALASFDPTLSLSVTQGALVGVLIGIPAMAFVCACVLTFSISPDEMLSQRRRILRRLLMLASPLLAIPATVYCLRRWCKWPAARGSAL